MKSLKDLLSSCFFLVVISLIPAPSAIAGQDVYDLVYIWDRDLDSVLDYKEQIETLFDSKVRRQLKIVGRGLEYGVIYDTNSSSRTVIQKIAHQGEILRKAGLKEAWAIKDQGYHLLYNVSYGLGPNLEALKSKYDNLYKYLGKEAGKNLFIEKTSAQNYTLIYRRRGDRHSAMRVARQHAKLLRKKRIRTSITPENNNEVVYGESSMLDNVDTGSQVAAAATTPRQKNQPKQVAPPRAVQTLRKDVEKTVLTMSTASAFEKTIEGLIQELRRTGKIRNDEKTGWMVYDLESNTSLVDINADLEFQAASMIKPFVAVAFFHQVKRGKLVYGPKSRRKMEQMIQRSSNSATNWVMRQAGGPVNCEKILRKYYGNIFRRTLISEYIPANGRTYKNSAPPSDYIRFLRALWNKELPFGKELRRIMALPGRDRLYHGTPIPQGTLVYNKTGSTAHLCGDMGILVAKTKQGKRHPYAIVGIIERRSRPSDYGRWMLTRGNVIRQVSTLVYEEMKKKYKLL